MTMAMSDKDFFEKKQYTAANMGIKWSEGYDLGFEAGAGHPIGKGKKR